MPTFLGLPNALSFLVVSKLDLEDFLSLRQVSRDVNRSVLPVFAKRYFTTRYVMLQRHSLEILVEISRHRTFVAALQNVEIGIDHLSAEPNHRFGSAETLSSASTSEERGEVSKVNKQAYDLLLEDQTFMMESGLDAAYLTLALGRLPNLESVVLDGKRRPWGARTQQRQTGVLPTNAIEAPESADFVKHVIRVVLVAIKARNLPLDSFDIALGLDIGEAVSPDMLAIPELYSRHIQSSPIQLNGLNLNVNPGHADRRARSASHILNFIALFPTLQRLHLSFGPRDRRYCFSTISQSLKLPRLQVLEINAVDCTEEEISTLLLRHKDTLEEVYFGVVDIVAGGGSWPSLLHIIHEKCRIRILSMYYCLANQQDVCLKRRDGDGVELQEFEISGASGNWDDTIEGIVVMKGRGQICTQNDLRSERNQFHP